MVRLVSRDSHHERFAVQHLAVETLDGGLGLLLVHHLREPEPARPPRLPVRDDPDVGGQSVRLQQHLELLRPVVVGHVRHVELRRVVDGRDGRRRLARRPRLSLEPHVDALPFDDVSVERLGGDRLLGRGEQDEGESLARQLPLPVRDDVDLQHATEGFEHLQHALRVHRVREVAHVQLRRVIVAAARR